MTTETTPARPDDRALLHVLAGRLQSAEQDLAAALERISALEAALQAANARAEDRLARLESEVARLANAAAGLARELTEHQGRAHEYANLLEVREESHVAAEAENRKRIDLLEAELEAVLEADLERSRAQAAAAVAAAAAFADCPF